MENTVIFGSVYLSEPATWRMVSALNFIMENAGVKPLLPANKR